MADNYRWFKVWCSAPLDPQIIALTPADRWAWVALGCYTKVHGTAGVLTTHYLNPVLACEMAVPPEQLAETISRLPNILISTAPVTWPHGHEKLLRCAGSIWGSDPSSVRGSDPINLWCERHETIIVTWRNWYKYQIDSTTVERGRASRLKRRGEESSYGAGMDHPPRNMKPIIDNPRFPLEHGKECKCPWCLKRYPGPRSFGPPRFEDGA